MGGTKTNSLCHLIWSAETKERMQYQNSTTTQHNPAKFTRNPSRHHHQNHRSAFASGQMGRWWWWSDWVDSKRRVFFFGKNVYFETMLNFLGVEFVKWFLLVFIFYFMTSVKKLRLNFYLKKYKRIYIKNILPQKKIVHKKCMSYKIYLIRTRLLISIC